MYLSTFDSCSRFKTKGECYGPGMGNSTCEFNDTEGVCKANYSKSWTSTGTQGLLTNFGKCSNFGKIILKKNTSNIPYKLNESSTKRHLSLNKRVLYEKKKKRCTLRQAAIAVKKRLVVLKIYRKKNPTSLASKTLNSDIKYLTKKYI